MLRGMTQQQLAEQCGCTRELIALLRPTGAASGTATPTSFLRTKLKQLRYCTICVEMNSSETSRRYVENGAIFRQT